MAVATHSFSISLLPFLPSECFWSLGCFPTVTAGTKSKTLMSCLVTHEKVPCLKRRWGELIRSCNHSLFLAHHLLIWEALQGGGHRKSYVKSKQNCQAFLSPTFVLANLHPLKTHEGGICIFHSRTSHTSGADTKNSLPKGA